MEVLKTKSVFKRRLGDCGATPSNMLGFARWCWGRASGFEWGAEDGDGDVVVAAAVVAVLDSASLFILEAAGDKDVAKDRDAAESFLCAMITTGFMRNNL